MWASAVIRLTKWTIAYMRVLLRRMPDEQLSSAQLAIEANIKPQPILARACCAC